MTESERLRLVEIAREIVKAPEILMVGTGLESTSATLKLSREAEARGADALACAHPQLLQSSHGFHRRWWPTTARWLLASSAQC